MLNLEKRILEISYHHKLSHIGSCLTALPIIKEIYDKKKEEDLFVLSSGHAGLALYVILEEKYGFDAEQLFLKHGVHPNRDEEHMIFCSTGSLGCGLPIAIGFALANKEREVYCLISDGECDEGTIWESLRFIEETRIANLHVYVNVNGYSAYKTINISYLLTRLRAFYTNINLRITACKYPFLHGVDAHYYVMTEKDYQCVEPSQN